MKKKSITIMMLVVLVSVLMAGCNIQRLGADEYYVKITGEGKMEDGFRYYTLKGYDKDGTEKEITFVSHKEESKGKLREDAYLRIYAKPKDKSKKEINEVTSYEEVKADELPPKAKEKLDAQ
ncbi:YxeA family protein [Paenibacillus sp. SC116]|uniref:YxeA family protein n=1 Tax=Paenibacillus sp. SC116 TaxID=2968986 RepID=UPI00215B655D|nr:YxeA family protein [Paenibacillus sp. SC116]MCR8845321.1 YxeA family protein [Paenibacillus sp. SC116]